MPVVSGSLLASDRMPGSAISLICSDCFRYWAVRLLPCTAARVLELKCPWASRTYIEFVCADKIKPEYYKQCQFSMWVTDLEQWDFANFDPRMRTRKLHVVTIARDDKMMRQFDACGAEFLADMDIMLEQLGVEFGDQW